MIHSNSRRASNCKILYSLTFPLNSSFNSHAIYILTLTYVFVPRISIAFSQNLFSKKSLFEMCVFVQFINSTRFVHSSISFNNHEHFSNYSPSHIPTSIRWNQFKSTNFHMCDYPFKLTCSYGIKCTIQSHLDLFSLKFNGLQKICQTIFGIERSTHQRNGIWYEGMGCHSSCRNVQDNQNQTAHLSGFQFSYVRRMIYDGAPHTAVRSNPATSPQ